MLPRMDRPASLPIIRTEIQLCAILEPETLTIMNGTIWIKLEPSFGLYEQTTIILVLCSGMMILISSTQVRVILALISGTHHKVQVHP